MKVKTEELIDVAGLLLRYLETMRGKEIEIQDDYYWEVASEERYRVYEEPGEHTIGSLDSDLTELRKLAGRGEPVAHGLIWLAAILRYLGEAGESGIIPAKRARKADPT